jgi:hypothetical protein
MKWAVVLAVVAAMTARAHAKGCHERSHVVGYQHCGRFGEWSPDTDAPLLWVDIGELTERFDTHASEVVGGDVVHGGLTHATGVGFAVRVLVGWRVAPRLALYAGGEAEAGGLVDRSELLVGALDRESDFFAAHAVAGARTVVGRIGLASELAAGGRYAGVIGCIDAACKVGADATGSRGELDVRVRADYWFASVGSVGVALGQNLFDANNREVLAVVTVHGRAWDGL